MSRSDTDPPKPGPVAPEGRRSRATRLAASRAGTPGTVPSQPQFSQPVRQIVLMLIVLGLVVAGLFHRHPRMRSSVQ